MEVEHFADTGYVCKTKKKAVLVVYEYSCKMKGARQTVCFRQIMCMKSESARIVDQGC
jgi:hypothetical protein